MLISINRIKVEYRSIGRGQLLNQLQQVFIRKLRRDQLFGIDGLCFAGVVPFYKIKLFHLTVVVRGGIDNDSSKPALEGVVLELINGPEHFHVAVVQDLYCLFIRRRISQTHTHAVSEKVLIQSLLTAGLLLLAVFDQYVGFVTQVVEVTFSDFLARTPLLKKWLRRKIELSEKIN